MINLKKFFKSKPTVVACSKAERDLLQYFISSKTAFDNWYATQGGNFPKLRFQFYFPSAIDFYFDEFKLFTAYFKKEENGAVVFVELKMSEVNYSNIKSADWKPFRDLILAFLTALEQAHKSQWLTEQRSLHEYQKLCSGKESGAALAPSYIQEVLSPQLV
jgi:hypothetical protein